MYQFLGKGGERGIKRRERRRRLLIILLLLLLFSAGIMTLYRLTGKRFFPGKEKVQVPDIPDIIFSSDPREDRAVRSRAPLDKSVWEALNKDQKQKDTGAMTPKRIPPHPILEIIGPDGKTLMKKK